MTADRNLLVPGTGGCKLMLDGQDLGWPGLLTAQAWLAGATGIGTGLFEVTRSAADLVAILSMEHADPDSTIPTRSTLRDGSYLAPGPVLELAYNQFSGFDTFTFDWRGDIRNSAALLLTHLRARRPANGRWRILAHSQGGLVVVAASKLCAAEQDDEDRAFSALVSHVALLATPLWGTIRSAEALISGADLSAPFAEHFRAIVRTWPAIHQMLPAWPGCVQLASDGATTPAPYNLLYEDPWRGSLSTDLLRRGREARRLFRAPLSRMNGVKVRILMSRAFATPNALALSGAGLGVHGTTERGDGLVPEETTRRNGGDAERAAMHSFDGPTAPHFALANDPVIVAEVNSFFGQ